MLNISNRNIDRYIPQHQVHTLKALRTPKAGKMLAWWLAGILFIFFCALFLPWQQNIRGSGNVTAFNPQNRPQTVQAVIAGRISKWHVREGDFVKKGDTIISITEVKEKYFDPLLLQRLQEQIAAKSQGIGSKQNKAEALSRQIEAIRNAMEFKVKELQAKLEAEKVRYKNAENQYARNKKLFEAGNIALTKFQEIEYKFQESTSSVLALQTELQRTRAEYLDKISKAESDMNATFSDLFEARADLSKMQNEFANTEIRSTQYQILAPQTGYVVKAVTSGIGETIKEGDAVCTIMPETQDIAVQMFVRAMDVPLVSKGRKVRIEFDGWPALQFSGWPSVSVGTFGGVVQVIDYVNSKPGEFRVLVIPDKEEEPWPQQLRMGSGTKAWIMLNDVPVWYELWRQLNGFPPSLYQEPLQDAISPIDEKDSGKK
jgi:multidrug resistance efflux pump